MSIIIVFALIFPFSCQARENSLFFKHHYDLEDMRATYGGDLATAVFDIVDGFPAYDISICFDNNTADSKCQVTFNSEDDKGVNLSFFDLRMPLGTSVVQIHTLVLRDVAQMVLLAEHTCPVELANQKMQDKTFIQILLHKLQSGLIAIRLFNITSVDVQEKYFDFLSYRAEHHLEAFTMFFGRHKFYEHVLLEIYQRNLIRRNLIYIFGWGKRPFERYFLRNLHYAMKIYAITNPRLDVLYYSQATSYKEHHMEMVNWWNHGKGLFNHPTLPSRKSVYKDFHKKVLKVPVLHKPPWHFVKYSNTSNNKSFEVLGGRDDRILSLLSRKLNFVYDYVDPSERVQGSSVSESGVFNGVLGLIWRREADLFIGDVTLTYERSNFVEFSFITLADSGAFVTHAPGRLNEALALLRPFQWQVWPAIGVTFVVVGPVLYFVIALPNLWHPRFRVRSHLRLFFDCSWFTVTILLKQTGREPSSSHKARIFIILLSISATYVITDMYSANLTSLLARPGREKAINDLYQLETAMLNKDYNLYVEKHSSSFGLLGNGTGIYGRLWNLMERRQQNYLVESVEEGVKLVREATDVAVLAGRETLFFDIQRFGATNFHLSEKLNTAYSAIAFQLGCPFAEEINKILMATFEAGIITKMTENEYEKLGKEKKVPAGEIEENGVPTVKTENRRAAKASEDNEKLKPISLKMLQGTFYLLCFGNAFSGLILIAEILFDKHHRTIHGVKKKQFVTVKKMYRNTKGVFQRIQNSIREAYRRFMHEAYLQTLEYIE